MGEDTYGLGRIAMLPAAVTRIQTDVKSAKIVMKMTAARLELDEVMMQCMVFVGM